MKTIIISILLVSTCLGMNAQQDPEAEPYLDKISKDLDPGYSLQLEFDYLREDLQTKTTVEGEGTLYLFGDKYKLEMEEFIIFFDGEKQYSLNLDVEEVYVSVPDPDNMEFMFSDPITLLRSYKDEFKYKVIGDANFQGTATTEIQLYPIQLGGPYALLKLFITPSKALKAIQVRHKEGIMYSMILKEFKKIDLPDQDFFSFNQNDYPNVDVIELVQ